MPLSRLRLRLAGWFALAFLAGLLLLSVTLFLYAHHQSDRRFTEELATQARDLAAAVRVEQSETPMAGLEAAVGEALDELPSRSEAFGVYATDGRRMGTGGPPSLRKWLPDSLPPSDLRPKEFRKKRPYVRMVPVNVPDQDFRIAAVGTTRRLDAETDAFGFWLAVSVPFTILVSLVAGYLLSRRALIPVSHLEHAIGRIGPDALDRRLPVNQPPDELDQLSVRFNALLQRLQDSQAQNQRFLEQAAHQIRTPLTLVLGEAELALERAHTAESRGEALRRIRLAATQMRRRVEELLILARASAGERASLTDVVELDGLALECADLMRSRAHALGRRLELGRVDPVVVTASESLLREAVVELLENACRHGADGVPVRLSVYQETGNAVIEVANGVVDEPALNSGGARGQGLGLQVVRWIAAEHGGRLDHRAESYAVLAALYLPANGAHAAAPVGHR
jgi:signal transduction histidine kinase